MFFDSFPDERERYGVKQYMLSVIAPFISYLNSLEIKVILKEISENIKGKRDWDIKEYWEKILKILSTESPLLNPQ